MTGTYWVNRRKHPPGSTKYPYQEWEMATCFPTEEEAKAWVAVDPKNRQYAGFGMA